MTFSMAATNTGAGVGVGTGSVGAPSAGADAAQHRRLADAAEQFEAMFLQQLMKGSDTESGEGDGKDDSGAGGGGDSSYSGFAAEFASKAIAKAGGLGIARSVIAGVERVAARSVAAHDMNGENIGARLKSS